MKKMKKRGGHDCSYIWWRRRFTVDMRRGYPDAETETSGLTRMIMPRLSLSRSTERGMEDKKDREGNLGIHPRYAPGPH